MKKFKTIVDIPSFYGTIKAGTLSEPQIPSLTIYAFQVEGGKGVAEFKGDYIEAHPEFFQEVQEKLYTAEDMIRCAGIHLFENLYICRWDRAEGEKRFNLYTTLTGKEGLEP